MLTLLIVADDLTGANDTGALLAGYGYKAVSSPTHEVAADLVAEDTEILSINADTRALPMRQAYEQVKGLVRDFYPAGALLSKRIDSTLRGNVGAEIDAVLDALPVGTRAAVVSASPGAGRICLGGAVLVHGVPLMETDMAYDVRTPVKHGFVPEIIAQQSERKQALVSIDTVVAGPDAVCKAVKQTDAPILVFDATSDRHLRCIAEGLKASGLPFVCFDPGAFTMQAMQVLHPLPKKNTAASLIVVGSRTVESRRQVDYLQEKGDFACFAVDLRALLASPESEIARAAAFFQTQADARGYVVHTTGAPELPGRSEEICGALCRLALQLLRSRKDIASCYLSGGDIARGFLAQAQARGVELLCELLPLAVCGRILGGDLDGLLLLTKGGMIGGPDAIWQMLEKSAHFLNK